MLLVGTSSIPLSTSYSFSECDDNYDGIITFDFSDAESEIFSIFPSAVNIMISYYENERRCTFGVECYTRYKQSSKYELIIINHMGKSR